MQRQTDKVHFLHLRSAIYMLLKLQVRVYFYYIYIQCVCVSFVKTKDRVVVDGGGFVTTEGGGR